MILLQVIILGTLIYISARLDDLEGQIRVIQSIVYEGRRKNGGS